MKKMKKALVTGGAGYIGSIVVPYLLEKGYAVTVVDNFKYGQVSLLDCCSHSKLDIVRGDVRDRQLMSACVRQADVIFPLACLTGAPLCDQDPDTAKAVNLNAVRLILQLRSKSQQVIFPTTNSGYGVGQKGIYCTEKTPLRPVSHYGRLKVEAEKCILVSGNAVTLRLATVFGISPRMRLDLLVNDFVYRAVTDRTVVLFESHFKRNYIHVRDVASAFLFCLDHFSKMKNEPYNVGLSDCNISKRELCQEIKKQIPNFNFVEAEIGKDPDQRDYIVSNAKIEKSGFQASYSLSMGITELIKGYQVIRKNQFSNV